jgi:UPF0716 protein FxsA
LPSAAPADAAARRTGRRFLAAFGAALLVAVAEVVVLVLVSRQIGWLLTFVLMIATSVLGIWVLRREGARSWQAFRADLRERRPPGPSATDGLLVLFGGVLMVLPGFITDLVGVLLVIRPTRWIARSWAQSALTRRLSPVEATTLFGPRTVRVRTGAPQAPGPDTRPRGRPSTPTDPIEGEIIDPR